MNKASKSNDDYEMLDDYSATLDNNWSKVVRGKHYNHYPKDKQPVVKITDSDGIRYVKLRRFETKVIITPSRKLTAQVDFDIPPGEPRVTLLIQEPANFASEVAIANKDGERDVAIKTFKTKAFVTPDNKLTAQVDTDILPGEYQSTLIIEEPTNSPTFSSNDSNQ
ncbi:MAG: hypothetical protein Fur006_67750 [Coleofasciculaceae cyanobacterium]